MSRPFSYTTFYKELESGLTASTAQKRKVWATAIIENNIPLNELSTLLEADTKIAMRFFWFLSEIGMINPPVLFAALPSLLEKCDQLNHRYISSFASLWLIAGVPPENEGRAIDLLFQWLLSADTTVTIKSRAMQVLFRLTQKYPELKEELKLCLTDQMGRHTTEFEKKLVKLLPKLES